MIARNKHQAIQIKVAVKTLSNMSQGIVQSTSHNGGVVCQALPSFSSTEEWIKNINQLLCSVCQDLASRGMIQHGRQVEVGGQGQVRGIIIVPHVFLSLFLSFSLTLLAEQSKTDLYTYITTLIMHTSDKVLPRHGRNTLL